MSHRCSSHSCPGDGTKAAGPAVPAFALAEGEAGRAQPTEPTLLTHRNGGHQPQVHVQCLSCALTAHVGGAELSGGSDIAAAAASEVMTTTPWLDLHLG